MKFITCIKLENTVQQYENILSAKYTLISIKN